jgi:hypothetical protein
MNQFAESSGLISLPNLPVGYMEKFSIREALRFRLFGTEEIDLAIDFSPEVESPALVTRILDQCAARKDGKKLPADFFREMPIGKRLECLLRLAAGDEQTEFSFPFKCGSCAAELELNLTLDEIAELQREADLVEHVEIEISDGKMLFRKPRGIDQEHWQRQVFTDEQAATRQIISSLQITSGEPPPELSDETLRIIDEAMDAADPLVNFNCTVNCAECAATNSFDIDLYRFALDQLRRRQWRLLYTIHRLATRYHWSEAEIFAVPDWRRRQYLDLISNEKTK